MSPMMEFYPQVKWTHVHAVMCSGAIFALLWGSADFLGRKIERERAEAYAAHEAAGGAPAEDG